MDKDLIKKVLLDQEKKLPKHYVRRDVEKKVRKSFEDKFVTVISGIRRSGKSTLMKKISTEDHFYVDFEDERFMQFTVQDFQTLQEVLIELYGTKDTFLFDEIQNVQGWERFVRRLHDQEKKICVTGSNASMLSKELGTRLTGRNIRIELYPYSFKEYVKRHNINVKKPLNTNQRALIKKRFNEYLQQGGFPQYIQTQNKDYLKNLYSNIIYRDVVTRHKLKKEKALLQLTNYISTNITNPTNYNKLSKHVGVKSPETVKDYIHFLQESYLVFELQKFSYSIKKQVKNDKKYYFIDAALRNQTAFTFSEDYGKLLENAMFLHFKQRSHEMYYYKEKGECDFIVQTKQKHAIQVIKKLSNQNKEREIQGVLEAMNYFNLNKGYIITENQEKTITKNNKTIYVLPAWKELLYSSILNT